MVWLDTASESTSSTGLASAVVVESSPGNWQGSVLLCGVIGYQVNAPDVDAAKHAIEAWIGSFCTALITWVTS